MVVFGIDWNAAINTAQKENLLDVPVDISIDITDFPGADHSLECLAVCHAFRHGSLYAKSFKSYKLTDARDRSNHPEAYLYAFFSDFCTVDALRNYVYDYKALEAFSAEYAIDFYQVQHELYRAIAIAWVNNNLK